MDAHDTLQAMLAAGKKFSFDVGDLGTLPPRLVILSVKYVSKEVLWTARYVREGEEGSGFVHWPLVHLMGHGKNALGGCAEWLGMLSFCHWDDLQNKAEAEIGAAHPMLTLLRRNMRACNLDTGGGDAWTLVCKVFVLMLVQGLPSQHTLEVLTCNLFKKDTRQGCIELLAKQAEHLFTPAQYEATLGFVLDRCRVDRARLEQTLALARAAAEDKRLSLSLSRMAVIQGRPRLRDRVSSLLKTDERKAQVRPAERERFFWGTGPMIG